jgi:hypothetical protein
VDEPDVLFVISTVVILSDSDVSSFDRNWQQDKRPGKKTEILHRPLNKAYFRHFTAGSSCFLLW